MKITAVNASEMQCIFDMRAAVDADKEALKAYSAKECKIPLRVNLDVPEYEGQSLYMPGYAAPESALGIKIVSVYPRNIERGLTSVPATMVVLDAQTGMVCGLLDGTWLTQQRTGAVAGAATELLAREDAAVFALFGTGGQAECQLEAVLTVRPGITQVRVFDLSTERADDFVRRMSERFAGRFPAVIERADSSAAAITGADIITTVTTASEPVFDGSLVEAGTHINAVGSYTPQMCEVDPVVLLAADKVYCDTRDALVESGDIQIPLRDGRFDLDKVTGELGEALLGAVPGRESAEEITYFESTGNAVLDVVVAQRIYAEAVAQGRGSTIDL
ncbi:ornithine cyclodeaminase [Austwickia chelonae]|uniref:Ornithine cyclodeaminase/mu-crystallin family protein n=1 Tax=Austwickia chelonae NBRC 105200 TaxID=1184607 RepID=K6UMN1_9MICO|nr:ornithine cyclodeaminase [Austwickia chelonae]GAB78256.1 ornithine cyclodeaminase/mu-crystallin family protein [Austwickia chelonae NBRC 105200]SEV99782.1 ornithine cyclodeaminase [Austwickia chelonae]